MTEQDPTIKDLFRVINDMRTDQKSMREEMRAEFQAVRSEMREGFKEASEERAAIRAVVDNELASQEQVNAVEAHVKDVQRTLKQHGKRLDAIDRAQKHPV